MNSEKDIFYDEMELLNEELTKKPNGFLKKTFKVFSFEASSGKTRQTVESAIKTKREMLIVTKFKAEVDMLVKDINKGAGFAKAIGVVSDIELIKENNNLVLSDKSIPFFEYSVIVITHSQYYKLCKGEKPWLEELVKDFDTLLIDEEFNPIKNNLYTFTIKKNSEMLDLFSNFGMYKELKEITSILEYEINQKDKYAPTNQNHWIKINEDEVSIELKCTELVNEINTHAENINIKLYDYEINNARKYYLYDLIEYVELVQKIVKNCIKGHGLIQITEGRIATYDYDFKYFMLKNNIMLDASANFSTIYNSEMFEVVKSERKIDHSKCKVFVVKIPTTTSTKNKIAHLFRPKLTTYVTKNLGEYGKGLIVTKKDESESLECVNFKEFDKEIKDEINSKSILEEREEYEERVSFCNYENQRGRNDYADYNHVFLAHTYRQPPHYYIFLYEYFFRVKATDEAMRVTTKLDGDSYKRWSFHNCNELDKLMFTDMVSSQYQSLKRISRNREPKANYHFFTTDFKVVLEVLEQLKGIDYDNNITVIEEVEFLGERVSKRSKEDILRDYIEQKLSQGKWESIKSTQLQKDLGISRPKWNEIWKDEEFLCFAKAKRIKQGRKQGMKADHVYKY